MKKLILGFILGLAGFPLICDGIRYAHYKSDSALIDKLDTAIIFPGYGLEKPFIGNCTKDVAKNGHGWVFVTRDYYKCGRVAIFISDQIYGEYQYPRDLEAEKKACNGCKL